MIADDKPNPFEVLAVPVTATDAEIAASAQELGDLAETEEDRQLYRWAREQLATHPRTRREYTIFEVPGAIYDEPGWSAFEQRHRRPPVNVRGLAGEAVALTVEDFDLVALVGLLIDGLLDVPAPDLARPLAAPPVPFGPGWFPLEIRDVIFG